MKKFLSIVLILMLAVTMLAGCGQKEQAPGEQQPAGEGENLSGKITIAGSTSVQPLSDELAGAFNEEYPDVSIEVQGGGSSVGVKSATDKIVDIGATSRDLKDEEKSAGLKEYVIAKDGIAVILNPANKVEDLTLEQVKKIFTGEITNWKEVGGDDKAITVVSREQGSGTRGAFIEITGVEADKKDMTTANALVQPSTGAVKQTVANTPDAIGYISMGGLDETIKTVKIEGVEATEENAKTGSYKIARPFIFLTNGEESELVKAFIDFVMNEGQEIVAEEFIPVK